MSPLCLHAYLPKLALKATKATQMSLQVQKLAQKAE